MLYSCEVSSGVGEVIQAQSDTRLALSSAKLHYLFQVRFFGAGDRYGFRAYGW